MEEYVVNVPRNYRQVIPAKIHENGNIIIRCKVNGVWVYRDDFISDELFREEIRRLHDKPRRN